MTQTSSIGALLIDWQSEEAAERARKRSIRSERGLRRVLAPLFDGVRLWVVLILTGAGVGIIGAYLDVLVAWLSDLKTGHCRYGIYYNQQACCSGLDGKEPFLACALLCFTLIKIYLFSCSWRNLYRMAYVDRIVEYSLDFRRIRPVDYIHPIRST